MSVKKFSLAGLILFLSILLFVPLQHEWIVLYTAWTGAWLAFYLIYRKANTLPIKELLLIALGVRLLAIFSFPNLSDDVFRFIWDGYLLSDGINPYLYSPSEIIATSPGESYDKIFTLLNSPDYHSIYPPIMQGVFWIGAVLEESIPPFIVMKIILFFGELLSLILLYRLLDPGKGKEFMMYALNPLIIIEGMGNLHFEILAISGIALAVYGMKHRKWRWGGISLGTAIGIKLNPLIFLPLSIQYLKKHRGVNMLFWSLAIAGLSLTPLMFLSAYKGFWSSIRLYFQNFEFNAGPYYLLREIISYWTEYNPIATLGPLLGLVALVLLFILSVYPPITHWKDCLRKWQWGFLVYLLFSTIIHPWYIIPLVFLSTLTSLIFPIVWSVLIILSYSRYGMENVSWYYLLIGCEYLGLCMAILWDIKKTSGNR